MLRRRKGRGAQQKRPERSRCAGKATKARFWRARVGASRPGDEVERIMPFKGTIAPTKTGRE